MEHVIIEGGSTDGMQEVVARYDGRTKKFIGRPSINPIAQDLLNWAI